MIAIMFHLTNLTPWSECNPNPGHQESMAGCVLAFIEADYDMMLEKFKGMGVLPEQPQRWVGGRWVDCTFEDFRAAFLKALFAASDGQGCV
jgi:hypothetical protein